MKPKIVLSVDDNEDDQYLLKRAWEKSGIDLTIQEAFDGNKALEYLSGSEPFNDREAFPMPSIILLDLKMPRKNGFEVLDWMKQQLAGAPPVAVFTSSQNSSDIQRAYDLGARWYVTKPVEHSERQAWIELIGQWLQNPKEIDLSKSPYYRGRTP